MLNSDYTQIQKRLNRLYDDKLDGEITPEFYKQKFKQYTKEKEEIVSSIKKHSNAQTKYFELGISILELSQRAKEIYQKATIEEKRTLLSLIFSNLRLNEGKLSINYTKPFEILAGSVLATKKIEPQFLTQKRAKSPEIAPLLARWDDFRTFKWIDSVKCPELVLKQTKELLAVA